MKLRRIPIIFCLACLLPSQSHAATRTWSGAAGTVFWANTNNWIEHVAPAINDDVVFPSGPTVHSNVPNSVVGVGLRSLTYSAAGYRTLANGLAVNHEIDVTHGTINGVTTI